MGLREKVTLTIVIIALIQIACRHCMPRTSRKASLKRYLNDLKPVKNNPVPTPFSPPRVNKKPKQTFGKTARNGRISQNSLPKKSLYKTYNFPENEYPLDNSPRDPFRFGMNFNENNHVNTLQKARNLQSSAISDLKKEMKMKRKLLSNKQVNNEDRQMNTDMSLIKFAPSPDSTTRLLDSETFPEVQYPLNTMDTWGPNYWNYLPFTQEKPFPRIGQQTFNHKAKEDINQPLTRLTKAKASKYLQSYDKLKEEHKRTSTENSKRSNVGQTGLNFTKTATCERVSDDFITAGLVSNIPSNSTEMKKALTSSANITASSENTCPVTEYHPVPIPYKVIENINENISPALELKYNTEELADVDNSNIAQTLQLIQEILFNDDTCSAVSPGNFSKELEKNMSATDCSDIPESKDITITLVDCGKNITIIPSKESSQEVSDDMPPIGILQNNLPSVPDETIPENIPTVAGPLNVRMPFPFAEPLHEIEALTNAPYSGPTKLAPLSNGFAVPSSTSIIIIPMNDNAVGKSKSHMFETTSDTPIIVYLPSTHTSSFNQTVSSSLDYTVPNNQLYNVLSNMAPLQNDNPFSPALVSELLNSNSDSGSSLPIDETLPTNSMCYNNESSPSSIRDKPISDTILHKLLTDDAPFVTTTRDAKMSEQPIETGDLDVNTNTLPPITDFEHPLLDFSGSEFTSLSHGPYNNVLNNELPIVACEIDSDQQILNDSSNDLFIPTQNVTSQHLHNTTSMDSVSEDSLSEIPNDVPLLALDKNFSSVTPTDSIEILQTNTPLPEYILDLQEPVDTLTESLPQPIDKILLSTTLIEPPSAELPQPKESPFSPTLLSETFSDKLPEIMDAVLSTPPVSVTSTDSTSQHKGNTPSTEVNNSPMMTDMTLKTELYKIRQILDKMLSIETPTYSQPPLIDTTLLPNYDSDRLLLPMNETPTETLPVPAVDKKLLPPATVSLNDSLRLGHEMLPPISVDATPTETLSLPGNKLVIPNKLLETDSPSLPIDETIPPILEFETSADNKPYILDNLVTPLSETVTSRTKDTTNNGLSQKMDDLPLKMDLKFPDIYEVSSDDLPLSVENKLQTQVVETLTSVSEVPTGTSETGVLTSNPPKPTDVLTLPADEVLEDTSPDVSTGGVKTLMSGFTDKLLQDFPSSKVPSDDLPTLPMNVFKLPSHETFPDGQFNETSSTGPPQNDHLPSSVQKLIPDLSLSNAFTNEPSLEDDLPSLVINKIIEILHSTVDTKDLPLVLEHLLSPKNDMTPDSVVTDILSAVSPSLNKGLQTTKLDQTSDEVLSVSTVSDIPRDELTIPAQKMSPLTDDTPTDLPLAINKTPTTSKLPITKALLKNVLSDINKGGLSLVAKTLPITPQVDEKSPLSETKTIPLRPIEKIFPTLRPVEKIFPNSEHTDNLIKYEPFSGKPVDTSIADLPSQSLLPTDEMHKNQPYIPIHNVEAHDKRETQSLDDPTHDLPVLIETVYPKDTTKTPSSSKLPITKALLETVLSDITTKSFSVPVAQSLPLTSPSVLDKTLYYVESPISHITKGSPALPVDKILPNTSLSDHSTDTSNLPISIEDNLLLPIDKTFSESQSLDIPTELSSPVDDMSPDIPNISIYDKEQDESENPSSKNLTDDLLSALLMEGILSLSKDMLSDLKNPKNKIHSSSKLPLTKALLENVLSDITTKGFSVAQSLPVTSPSVLDKRLYYEESPISHIIEGSPALPVDKMLPDTSLSNHQTDHLPISFEDKTFSESQSLNIPTELSSPIDNFDNKASSKLPITKALLENVLSDITTKGFSVPVAQSLPLTSPSVLDKTLYYVESPISQITEDSPTLPVDKILPITSLSDHSTDTRNLPISIEDNLLLPIDKTFSESLSLDIPTELSSPVDDMRPDIPNISIYDNEQNESENPSSKNLTDDLLSALLMEGILSLYKDTLSDSKNPNNKIHSSSKLPITKALLENVLSDITIKGFSVPVAQSLPLPSPSVLDKILYFVESPISHITEDSPALPVDKILPITTLSDHSTDNLPISMEDNLLVPIDKTFSESQSLDIPTELSSPVDDMRPDIPNISIYDKEQDESENPSSKNLTDDLLSALLMEGILSLSKDMLSDLKNPKNKIHSSSKLPITKALLENVLSDITTKGFSVAQSLPVTSPSVLDKTLYYVESPISHIIEGSPALPVDKMLPDTSLSNHQTDHLPISFEVKTFSESQSLNIPTELSSPIDNLDNKASSKLPITKALLENILSDITTKGFSVPVAQSLPLTSPSVLDKTLYYVESPISHITEDSPALPVDKIRPITSLSDHSTGNLPISMEDNLLVPIDKPFSESQSLDIPTELSSPIDNLDNKASSKLPITKALLENVLSDITTKGFSVPVAQSLPLTSPSVSDKTLYYVESPISQITEDSPTLPVDKILPITSLSDHSTDTRNLPISIKDNLLLPIDKTFSESQSLDIPTELSSPVDDMRPDIPNISIYDKEQDESENPSSKNLTDNLLSALLMEGILSLSKDMLSDLKNPKNKIHSSSKLPITKALLENVLSDITTKGFSVAQSLPITSPSVLDKTLYYVESPISHIIEGSPALPVDKMLPDTSFSNHQTDNLPIYFEDKTFSESQSLNIPTELSSPIDNLDNKASSKLPITKALLENVLSDITTKGFSVPVAQSLPLTSPSVLDKTLYYVESPISHITEDSPALPVDKILPITSLSDHSTDTRNLPISIEDNLLLPIDKTFSESRSLDIPTELSSPVDDMHPDIPNISIYDKEQDESENPSSKNLTDDLLSALLMEGILSLSKDTLSDSKNPNNKIHSSSKLPITKALLENVLSDITIKGFSVPVAQSLPLTSPSVLDKTLYYVESPISHITEGSPALPVDKMLPDTSLSNHQTDHLPISFEDKTFSESQSMDIPTELSSPIDNLDNKASSKLPITKALLEYVLSDITTEGFSVPLAQSLPLTSPSVLDKTLYFVETPISHITEDSPALPIDKILPITSLSNHSTDNLPIFIEDNLLLPIDIKFSESQSLDIPTELSSPVDDMRPDIPNISIYDKEQDDSENPSSKNLTDDLLAALLMEGTLSLSKDMLSDLKNPNNKIHSSSKLPITKALLENVLSDITTKGFSVTQFLPLTSPSVLDKTLYYVESPISHITKGSPALTVDKMLPDTSFSNHQTDNLPISFEDKTFSESQSLDIPTELSSPIDDLDNKASLKLPLTKALLENVLSDITTKGFSVAQSLPLTSPSVLDKTLYYVESPISHITKGSPALTVDKMLPDTSFSNHQTDNLPIDETFSELQSLDIPTEYNLGPDIPNISTYDKEQNESENPSFKNPTDDLSSASPMEGILSFSKDTPSDLTLPNNKIPSSSKLPITKALLENVVSDINTKGFSFPVSQSLPVISPSVVDKALFHVESPIFHITKDSSALPVDKILPDTSLSFHQTENLPISIENNLPLPKDKTFSESQSLAIPSELSSPVDNMRPDVPNIAMYGKEQDESENPSSKNLTDDLLSALLMEGILSLSKDMLSDLKNPNNKIQSSSKLPITKALLENVLSDITTKGFSVAQSLPLTSPSVLDKTLYYVESPISHITEDSPALPIDKNLPDTSFSNHHTKNLPISIEDTLPIPIDKTFSELQSLDIPTELSSLIDNLNLDIPNISTYEYDKEQDESENPSSKYLTDDLSSASPLEGILSHSKDTLRDPKNPNSKIPSSSKLPITKALLENVLSDINTKVFSVPVAQSLPVTPPSVLDKTIYYIGSRLSDSDIIEDSPTLPVDKILPNTALSDHPSGNILTSTEDTLPLPIDETSSELQSLDIPTELSSKVDNMRSDIPKISMYGREKDETANPSSENPTDDLSSTSLMAGIPSLSKETLSDVKNPNNKAPSSSKLPITKALLENVLSDINTRGFSLPVALALPVTSSSVLDKALYYVESPISHITEDSPALPVDKILPNTSFSNNQTNNLPISTEDSVPLPIDETFSGLQSLDISRELSSPIDNLGLDIPNISMYDKEQEESEYLSFKNLIDDLSSASPMEGIPSFSKDTLSDLKNPNNKAPSSSKLPITKALLENVLSDINTRGFSLPVALALPVTSPSVLDKALYYVESPISHITEDSPALPVDKILPDTPFSNHQTDNLPISTEDTVPLPIDETFSQSLDISRELSSPIDNFGLDIPNTSMYDKEQDESEHLSFKNLMDDLSSASPMEGFLSLFKDTPGDLTLPNNKTPSSSKLPIIKALLENVLSDINTRGFSVPVAQALPVAPRSQLVKSLYFLESPVSDLPEKSSVIPTDNFPSSEINEDVALQPTYPTLPDFPILGIPTDSNEQDEAANPSSENLTDDLSSLMAGILSKDTPSDVTLPNHKASSSSKLPITKALLENVLSNINTRGFSLPVAQTLPVAPRSLLNKTLYFLESPVSDLTEKSSVIPTDNFPSSGINEDVAPRPTDTTLPDFPILGIPTDKLQMDKIHNSDILTDDVGQEDNFEMLADDVEDRDICDNCNDDVKDEDEYKFDILTDDVEDKDKSDIWTDEVEDNDKSYHWTDDIEIEDSNESLFSDDPTDDVTSDLPLPRTKPYMASRIPIAKALLEIVLSDITDRGIHP